MKHWILQPMYIGVITLLGAFLLYGIVGAPDRSVPCVQESLKERHVCLSTVLEQWGNDVLWVDARNKKAFQYGHVQGALWLPEKDVENQLAIPESMEAIGMAGVEGRKVVVYCASDGCGAADFVANAIHATGFHSEIYVLHGGWKAIYPERQKLTLRLR